MGCHYGTGRLQVENVPVEQVQIVYVHVRLVRFQPFDGSQVVEIACQTGGVSDTDVPHRDVIVGGPNGELFLKSQSADAARLVPTPGFGLIIHSRAQSYCRFRAYLGDFERVRDPRDVYHGVAGLVGPRHRKVCERHTVWQFESGVEVIVFEHGPQVFRSRHAASKIKIVSDGTVVRRNNVYRAAQG